MPRSTRFRRRTRSRVGKHEYVWTCINVLNDLTLLNGACDAFPIVVRDDWARDPARISTIEKGAVLLRITGDIRVTTQSDTSTYAAAGSNFVWGIGKFDEDDSQILNLTTNFFGEDWLQVRAGTTWPTAANANIAPVPFSLFPAIDIRVKRKLTSDDEIRFVFGGFEFNGTSSATNSLSVSYEFRSLIQLP